MTLSDKITQVQQQLSQLTTTISDSELKHQLTALVDTLATLAKEADPNHAKSNTSTAPELKNGCYVFADQKGFFCPNCFDRDGTKAITTRINSKLRICSICRTSIK